MSPRSHYHDETATAGLNPAPLPELTPRLDVVQLQSRNTPPGLNEDGLSRQASRRGFNSILTVGKSWTTFRQLA